MKAWYWPEDDMPPLVVVEGTVMVQLLRWGGTLDGGRGIYVPYLAPYHTLEEK